MHRPLSRHHHLFGSPLFYCLICILKINLINIFNQDCILLLRALDHYLKFLCHRCLISKKKIERGLHLQICPISFTRSEHPIALNSTKNGLSCLVQFQHQSSYYQHLRACLAHQIYTLFKTHQYPFVHLYLWQKLMAFRSSLTS